jgi:hypothetical protein
MIEEYQLNQAVGSLAHHLRLIHAMIGGAMSGFFTPGMLLRRVNRLDILYWEAVEWRVRCDRECMFHAEVAMDDEATPVPLAALYRHAWALAWENVMYAASHEPSVALWNHLDRRGLIQ